MAAERPRRVDNNMGATYGWSETWVPVPWEKCGQCGGGLEEMPVMGLTIELEPASTLALSPWLWSGERGHWNRARETAA